MGGGRIVKGKTWRGRKGHEPGRGFRIIGGKTRGRGKEVISFLISDAQALRHKLAHQVIGIQKCEPQDSAKRVPGRTMRTLSWEKPAHKK